MAAPPPPPPPPPSVSSSALGTSLLVVTSSTSPVSTNSDPTSTLDTSSTSAATATSNSSTSHHQPNLNLILTIVFATFGGIIFLALLFGLVIPFIRRRCQKRERTMGIRPVMSFDDEKRHSIHYWPATIRSPGVGDEESNDGHDSLLTGTISTIRSRSPVGMVDTDSHRKSHQPHYQLASERRSYIQSAGEESRISRNMEDGEEEEEEAVNQGYLGVQPLEHHPGYSSIPPPPPPPPLANLNATYALVPNEVPFTKTDSFVHEQAAVASPVDMKAHDQDVTVSRSRTTKTVSTASMYSQDSVQEYHADSWDSGTEVATPRQSSTYVGRMPTHGTMMSEITLGYGRQGSGSDASVSTAVGKLVKDRARSSQPNLAGVGAPERFSVPRSA